MAETWFPSSYKETSHKEGDLLITESKNGKWRITKILKVERHEIKEGESIIIANKTMVAPTDDFLLILHNSFSDDYFDSFEQANIAITQKDWSPKIKHIARRVSGVGTDSTLVGNERVMESELEGYNIWKEKFSKGFAGIF